MKIICQIDNLNEVFIRLINGPLYVIITSDRINSNVFFKDDNKNLRYRDGKCSIILRVGDYVKVTLKQLSFHAKDILSIGFLENMADANEIKQYHIDDYSNSSTMMDMDPGCV